MDALGEEFEMRKPCVCGGTMGYSVDKSGQEVVRCAGCDAWCYNRPKAESGRTQRSVRSRPEIKPSQRYRILEQYGHACVSCGSAEGILHIGHLIPVDAWRRFGADVGMAEEEVWADENLCALCEECNLGMGNALASVRLMLRCQRIQRRMRADGAA